MNLTSVRISGEQLLVRRPRLREIGDPPRVSFLMVGAGAIIYPDPEGHLVDSPVRLRDGVPDRRVRLRSVALRSAFRPGLWRSYVVQHVTGARGLFVVGASATSVQAAMRYRGWKRKPVPKKTLKCLTSPSS